jgi:hypothetical protein
VTLRESVETVTQQSKELFAVHDFVRDQLAGWDPSDAAFRGNLEKFLHLYETRAQEGLNLSISKFQAELAEFMGYFLEAKAERVDKIVQTCLDIALRHNVSHTVINSHRKLSRGIAKGRSSSTQTLIMPPLGSSA